MGIYADCQTVINDKPPSTLTALEREVLYARIRAFSVRIQYIIWNIAATVLLYLFNGSLLNGYIWDGDFYKIIIFHIIQTIAITSYFLTSLSNPGYIELNDNENALFEGDNQSSDEEDDIIDKDDFNDHDNLDDDEIERVQEWNKNIIIDPNNAPFNFCWRCKFVRPIRSKHCYDCDRCISKFDHHCPMVGNCVGGKNHRYFLTFLVSQSIVITWSFQLSLMDLYTKYNHIISHRSNSTDHNMDTDMDSNYDSRFDQNKAQLNLGLVFRLLFFVCMFFAMLIVIGLCGFHCYLSSTNQTTYEMVKPHILEKWVKEENKRKKKYIKAHPKQNGYHAVNISEKDLDSDHEDDDDIDNTATEDIDDSHYRSQKENNMISFDMGYIKNLYYFWTAKLNKTWVVPLSCVLKDSDDDRSE